MRLPHFVYYLEDCSACPLLAPSSQVARGEPLETGGSFGRSLGTVLRPCPPRVVSPACHCPGQFKLVRRSSRRGPLMFLLLFLLRHPLACVSCAEVRWLS